MDRTVLSESATPTVALRWKKGVLQQRWIVTRYFDVRLERDEGMTKHEWRDIPNAPDDGDG